MARGRRVFLPILLIGLLGPWRAAAEPVSRSVVDRLSEILARDPSSKVRLIAAKKLGEIETAADAEGPILDALQAGLRDSQSIVRSMCLRSLARRGAVELLPRIGDVAASDPDPVVRDEAESARRLLLNHKQQARALAARQQQLARPHTVELGKIEVSGSELDAAEAQALERRVRDLVETQIEPMMPAIFPREDAGYRLNVRVLRKRIRLDHNVEVRCEVQVVVLELPEAHLRHATQAVASSKAKSGNPQRLAQLEKKVAEEATNAAVDEALRTVRGG